MAKPIGTVAALFFVLFVSTSTLCAEIEITVETDKSVYSFGEDVIVTVTVRNPTDSPITLHFGSSCKANYLMDNWFEPAQICLWIITSIVLDPNESYTDTFVHDHWQQYTCPLLPGIHTVAGIVHGQPMGEPMQFEVLGQPPILYVSTDGNDITGNGDPDNPFATIQKGINVASPGTTVIVREGTYRGPGNTDIDFRGKAVTLQSETGPENCIIDCNTPDTQHHRAFDFTAGERRATIIDGFTITNGHAYYGGAAICEWADPTFIHCIFRNCTAEYGGAIYLFGSSSAFTNCIFSGNSAGYRSAALAAEYSDATLLNCTFSGNHVRNIGRAIYATAGSWPHTIKLTNCILWNQIFPIFWPEIDSSGNAAVEVTYSNVRGGYAGVGNIDSDPCFVSPGYWAHKDDPNLHVWPNDPNALWIQGDYHLLLDSPCIDTGDPNYVAQPNDTDSYGNPRIADGNADCIAVVDMGAQEFFIPPVEVPMKLTPRTLNLTGKGKWVKAHLVLPETFAVADVNSIFLPRIFQPFNLQCHHMNVFLNDHGVVQVEAAFDRADFCRLAQPEKILEIQIEGSFTDCRYFNATDTIRILNVAPAHLVAIASHWLQERCTAPHFCGRSDINTDGVVNFLDLVHADNSHIEVPTR